MNTRGELAPSRVSGSNPVASNAVASSPVASKVVESNDDEHVFASNDRRTRVRVMGRAKAIGAHLRATIVQSHVGPDERIEHRIECAVVSNLVASHPPAKPPIEVDNNDH